MKKIMTLDEVDEITKKSVEYRLRDIEKINCIPKEEFVAYDELSAQAFDAWHEAKHNNDYAKFEPFLQKTIETKIKFLKYRNSDKPLYDLALDDYELGMTMEEYERQNKDKE